MREVPTGRKMPSVSIITAEARPKSAPPKPPMDPNEDQEQEVTFTCPSCGEKLSVQPATSEESEEIGGMGEGKY